MYCSNQVSTKFYVIVTQILEESKTFFLLDSYAVAFAKKSDLDVKAPWINTVRGVRAVFNFGRIAGKRGVSPSFLVILG